MNRFQFLSLGIMTFTQSLFAQQETKPAAPNPPPATPETVADFQSLGVKQFFNAEIKESIASWDKYLAKHPEDMPYHWQRGIALYYAERWHDVPLLGFDAGDGRRPF